MAGDFIFDSPAAHEYYNQLRAVSSANNAWNEAQADKQMAFQEASNAKAMDFNAKQAELNRSWQEMMSNTAYQRQVKDMLAAGLNPVLGVSNSGAAVPSGATASGVSASGSKAEADTTMAAAFAQMVNTMVQGQTARDVAEINADAAMKNAQTNADAIVASALYGSGATKYAAGVNAAASRYASDILAANTAAQLEWQQNKEELYNPIGIINEIVSTLTGQNNSDQSAFASLYNFMKDNIKINDNFGSNTSSNILSSYDNFLRAFHLGKYKQTKGRPAER